MEKLLAASSCAIGLGLALAVLLVPPASGQMGGGGQGKRGGSNHAGPNRGTPNEAPEQKGPGPEEHDAIDLFSRLCVSTRGDRDRVVSIIGDGDSTVEKMDPPLLRGLENGVSGGVGWIIHMPLGEKLLVEFPPGGACIVRAPRINPAQLEGAFQNLLDQYGSSDSFKVHRLESQTKTVEAEHRPGDDQGRPKEKLKYHLSVFDMTLPDTGKVAELGLATTDAKSVSIQATLSFQILPGKQP
jgi:hypothetical protein